MFLTAKSAIIAYQHLFISDSPKVQTGFGK